MTNLGVGVGLVFQVFGLATPFPADAAFLVVGAGVMTLGGINYAIGKGQDPRQGLITIVPVVGLLLLIALKDRHKDAPADELDPDARQPDGTFTQEDELGSSDQLIFDRVRVAARQVGSALAEVWLRGGPPGIWELNVKTGGKASRLAPHDEHAFGPADKVTIPDKWGVLSFLVQSHDDQQTTFRYGEFSGTNMEKIGELRVHADGRVEHVQEMREG
ncbi:MAG: hypothetical protein JNK16_13230 [Phycisphaerales bacterium]|nr:hypothetical protein [Phycisphaerales bacterium]